MKTIILILILIFYKVDTAKQAFNITANMPEWACFYWFESNPIGKDYLMYGSCLTNMDEKSEMFDKWKEYNK